MSWYLLPNGNIRHVNGLELQPEQDWFPTPDSLTAYTEHERGGGKSEAAIIKQLMDLATDCEAWARANLS